MNRQPLFNQLARIGIVGYPQALLTEAAKTAMAMDAAMLTAPNNAVPAALTAYIDPNVIKILTSPCNAEKVFDPNKNGTRGCQVAAFPVVEETGGVAPYGDYGTEGASDYNLNWPKRQEYGFQTITRWGDLESIVMGMAAINAANQKQESSANTIKRAHNRFWFYGVQGLENYGILNDPSLPAPISPATVGGAVTWTDKDADAIYADFVDLYLQLAGQLAGLQSDGPDMTSPLKCCLSNVAAPNLKKKNSFGVSVQQMLAEAFPNMTFITAPEYATEAGELVQLICPTVGGQPTGKLGYTELIHAHGVVRELSSYMEKKSAGTFGAIIFQPFAIAQMLGV
jgi:hypothetical protein